MMPGDSDLDLPCGTVDGRVKPGHDGKNWKNKEFVIAGLDPAIHGMSQCLRGLG
jgi:hypothetical protein